VALRLERHAVLAEAEETLHLAGVRRQR
jgi:hypothetical protein